MKTNVSVLVMDQFKVTVESVVNMIEKSCSGVAGTLPTTFSIVEILEDAEVLAARKQVQ